MMLTNPEPQDRPTKRKTQKRFYINPPLWLIGVFVGIMLGIATAWFDKHASVTNNQSVSGGLTIALLVSLIGIVIDTRASLEQRRNVEDKRARLMKALEECSLIEGDVIEMAEVAARVRTSNEDLLKHAKEIIDDCREELEEVVSLRIRKPKYELETLIKYVHDARHNIYATSTGADMQLWRDNDGEDYIVEQVAAIKNRHVNIYRLFVLTAGMGNDRNELEFLRKVMSDQLEKQINVKWIFDKVFYDSRIDYTDFVIVDDFVLVETRAHEYKVWGMIIDFDPHPVGKRTKQFLEYWNQGRNVEDLPLPGI